MPGERAVRRIMRPDVAGEVAIQRGIAADADNPEWNEADFAAARPARDVVPGIVAAMEKRRRGPRRAPTRVQISVRLDRDLVETLRAGGDGWQGRVNEVLRKAVLGKRRA